MKVRILKLETVDSTNTEALRHARQGVEEGLCIIARQQTAGRGRLGRAWISEPDAGLYMSLVLRPKTDPRFFPLLTLLAGVAVHESLSQLGIEADIKWVNDVLVDERKLCGILAETTDSPSGTAVVMGIGINLRPGNFHPEISSTSTSIESSTGKTIMPERIVEMILSNMDLFYCSFDTETGRRNVISEWTKRSSYANGKKVSATISGERLEGVTRGIDDSGSLKLELQDGKIVLITAGDIERLRAK